MFSLYLANTHFNNHFDMSMILIVDSKVEFYLIIYTCSILNYLLRLMLLNIIYNHTKANTKSFYSYNRWL